jgi:hypothetical protein
MFGGAVTITKEDSNIVIEVHVQYLSELGGGGVHSHAIALSSLRVAGKIFIITNDLLAFCPISSGLQTV